MISPSLESHLAVAVGPANAMELIEALGGNCEAPLAAVAAQLEHAKLDIEGHAGRFSLLNDQIGHLTARVEALESKCAPTPQPAQGVSK